MSMRGLSYFLTVAEELNFTTAAQKLYITQQTLSSHIKRLEEQYSVTLFERYPRLRLTPEGERMVRYASRIVRMERIMRAEFADISQKANGVLLVGSSRIRAKYFFPSIWQAYQQHFPNIEIRLVEGNSIVLERLALAHKVDICIGLNIADTIRLHTEPLMTEEVYFTISKPLFRQYFGADADMLAQKFSNGIDFADILGIPLILLPHTNRIRRMVDRGFEGVDVVPRAVFESNDNELIFNMCATGCGAAFCSKSCLFLPLDSWQQRLRDIYVFPLRGEKLLSSVAYPQDLPLPHYAQVFVDVCHRVFADTMQCIDLQTGGYTGIGAQPFTPSFV